MRNPSLLASLSTSTTAFTSILGLGVAMFFAPIAVSTGAYAAGCASPATFGSWLQGFKKEAVSQGISPQVVSEALDGLSYDPAVIAKDRGQGVFAQSFLQFAGRMVSGNRLSVGSSLLKKNAATFARIEQQYGVPGPVL